MNILVTGGAGFIGSHIVDAYLAEGHRVTVVDNLSTGQKSNVNPAAEFCRVDIRDAEALGKVMSIGKFDVVNHHAAQMDIRRSVADPVYDASVNIIGMLTLMELGLRSGIRRVVFASSGGAVYGEQEVFPASETHPTRPISPYGVAKLTTEQYLFYYAQVHGFAPVALRYANVYGPRQNPEGEAGVVAIFTTKMLQGGKPVVNGDGKQTRDYVFVGDVVKANVLALRAEGCRVYNVGTGIETDVNAIFRTIRAATHSNCEEAHGAAKKGEQTRSVLDCRRIAEELGWHPTMTLQDGLRNTVEYFRSR
jgi:UDP-glucose 4-epimerase